MTEELKKRLGDYEVLCEIGGGAQGKIFKAQCVVDDNPNTRKGEEVALKVVRRFGDDDQSQERFEREVRIFLELKHTNLVEYKEAFTVQDEWSSDIHCLVMEYLEGEDLSVRLKDHPGGLPFEVLKPVFAQVLEGLAYAREHGIIHRDLKPGNIFLCSDGRVKVIDFGIARKEDGTVTNTAGFKGTYDYMAPDFLSAGDDFRGDEQSDIFSLGVCFCKILTGRLPYTGSNESGWVAYLNRWQRGKVKDVALPGGALRVLNDSATVFMRKALRVDRNDRYASFREMLDDLQRIRRRTITAAQKEYEFVAYLGKGGFGEVFKARRKSDGLFFAVKRMFPGLDPARFQREARLLSKYPHPNIVGYEDFVTVERVDGEDHYLILEFLEGMPEWGLRNRIKAEGALDLAEVRRLFDAWLAALDFLHTVQRKPILHRDITPANLYAPPPRVEHEETPKLFDMGIARSEQTVTGGHVPGNPEYMAPEFITEADFRGSVASDLYCVGLCLYESLAGKPAFERLSRQTAEMWQGLKSRADGLVAIGYDYPVFREHPAVERMVRKAIARDPSQRFSSAAEMRAAVRTLGLTTDEAANMPVESAAQGEEAETAFVSQPQVQQVASALRRESRRRWMRIAAAAAAGILLVGAVVFGIARRGGPAQAARNLSRMADQALSFEPSVAYVDQLRQSVESGRKWKEQYPEHPEISALYGRLATQWSLLEGNFEGALRKALDARDLDAGRKLLDEWKKTEARLPYLGLTVFGHGARTLSMEKRIQFLRDLLSLQEHVANRSPLAVEALRGADAMARQNAGLDPYPEVQAWWRAEHEALAVTAKAFEESLRQAFSAAVLRENLADMEGLARQWTQALAADARHEIWPVAAREAARQRMTSETERLLIKFKDMALAAYAANSLEQADKLAQWLQKVSTEAPVLAEWLGDELTRLQAEIGKAQQDGLKNVAARLPATLNPAAYDGFRQQLEFLAQRFAQGRGHWSAADAAAVRAAVVAACARPARHLAERAERAYEGGDYATGHRAFDELRQVAEAVPAAFHDALFADLVAQVAKAHDLSRRADAESRQAENALDALLRDLENRPFSAWSDAFAAWRNVKLSPAVRAALPRGEKWQKAGRVIRQRLADAIGEADREEVFRTLTQILAEPEVRDLAGSAAVESLTTRLASRRKAEVVRTELARIRRRGGLEQPENLEQAFCDLARQRVPEVHARKDMADLWHETDRFLLDRLKSYAEQAVTDEETRVRLLRVTAIVRALRQAGIHDPGTLDEIEAAAKTRSLAMARLAAPTPTPTPTPTPPPTPHDDPEAEPVELDGDATPAVVQGRVESPPPVAPPSGGAPALPAAMAALTKPAADLLGRRQVREAAAYLTDELPEKMMRLPPAAAEHWSALRLRLRILREEHPLLDLVARSELDRLDAEIEVRRAGRIPERWRTAGAPPVAPKGAPVSPVAPPAAPPVVLSPLLEKELKPIVTLFQSRQERKGIEALCHRNFVRRLEKLKRRHDAEIQWRTLLDWVRRERQERPFLDVVGKNELDMLERDLNDRMAKERAK